MTLSEAKKLFDVGADEDPRPRLTEFMNARDQVAALVRTTSDRTIADRYRHDLVEIEKALAVIQEYLLTAPKSQMPAPLTGNHAETPDQKISQKSPQPAARTEPPISPPVVSSQPAPEVVKTPETPDQKIFPESPQPAAKTEPPISPPVVSSQPATEVVKTPETPDQKITPKSTQPAARTEPPVSPPVVSNQPAPEVVKTPEVQAPPSEPPAGIKSAITEKIPEKVPPVTPPVVTSPPASTARTKASPSILPKAFAADPVSKPPAPPAKPRSRTPFYILGFALLFLAVSAGGWFYLKNARDLKQQELQNRITLLNGQGKALIESRRWQDASNRFAEIESISPGSHLAAQGRHRIEAALADEQFVSYWTGQATAELDAGRLDEAVAAANQVLDKYPREKEATAILARIDIARAGQARVTTLAAARNALDQRDWNAAIANARKILTTAHDDADAQSILATATAAQEKAVADQAKAEELLKQAIARDNGQFDQQALDLLREAKSLAPGNAEIAARFEKLSSYTRTLRVPGDFATPQEALANARNRDRIVIGAAVWKGPLVIEAAIELQGAGHAETIIECAPEAGSSITIGPDAKGAHISGITFRHESFVADKERFSVALVRRGSVTFTDCHFTKASGHGLAVIEGGQATVSRSRFADNGWNGAAAIGKGSTLEVRDSEALDNFENGIETWEGAAATIVSNRCEGNSRNGIHTDNDAAAATIEGNQLIANREFGLVLDSAGSGKITGNTARSNLLGGLVIRKDAAKLPVTNNQATLNQGPGLILEKGLAPAAYTSNTATDNQGQQILSGTDLTATEPPPVKTEAPPRPVAPKPKKGRR